MTALIAKLCGMMHQVQFSCGTEVSGSGADTQLGTTSISSTTITTTATYLGTVSVTPTNSTGDVYVRAMLYTNSASNTDQTVTAQIRVASGTTCNGTLLASGNANLTEGSNSDGPAVFAVHLDTNPGASLQQYAICGVTTTSNGANVGGLATAEVIDTSPSSGGATVTVRESDLSSSVGSVSTLEFGPASSNNDFIVTNQGSGVARVEAGTNIALLADAESVTGGWSFNTASTTFTTSILANGGLSTTSNTDLSLSANGVGNVLINPNAGGDAALIIDKLGNNDIFTASASGTTRFTINNSGAIGLSGDFGTSSKCLQSNGAGAAATWEDCSSGAGGAWTISDVDGTITPLNNTVDFLVGGVATTSAKFAILNVNTNTPTASVSAQNANGYAIYLDPANGRLQTVRNQTLTLGGGSTGNIIIDSNTGQISLADNTTISQNLTIDGSSGLTFSSTGGINLAGGVISDSVDGVDINDDLDVTGSINLTTGNLAFSSTGGITLTGGTISDATDEVDINDDLAVAGSTGLTFTSTGGIILNGGVISDNTDGVDINDDLDVSGTTGITLTGAGADLIFANSERISNDTNGTITLGRNDTGIVTLTSADDDATAAFTIQSGGAATLTLDTGAAATLNLGTTNSNDIVLGNTGSTTNLTFTKGASGNITLTGFDCSNGYTNGGVLTTDSSGHIVCQDDDGGASSFVYIDENLGALHANNFTLDFLLGSDSTSSAKFAFKNVLTGTPTASISAITTDNAIFIDANGNIKTTNAQTLTLGGGDSGEVYSASLLRLDDTNGIVGGGLSDCTNPLTSKLLWDASTNRFSCGTDQGGGGGSSITVRESDSSPAVSAIAVLEFGPGTTSTDEFIVTDEGSSTARVRIGNQVGMLNQAESVTGGWSFNTASTTFTTSILANGGLSTTSNTDLSLSANGVGNVLINPNAGGDAALIIDKLGNNDIFTASASGTTRFTINNSGAIGLSGDFGTSSKCLQSNGAGAAATWEDCSSGAGGAWTISDVDGTITPLNNTVDFLVGGVATTSAKFAILNVNTNTPTASVSAQNANGYAIYLDPANGRLQTVRNQTLTLGGGSTGNIIIDSNTGQISLADNTTISQNLTIDGSSGLTFSSTGGINLAGGVISDSVDGVDINDDLDVTGSINLTTGNLAFSSTGGITLTGGTISDATDEVDINDDLAVAGSTGLTFTSTGGIILNGGVISDNTDGVDINDDLDVSWKHKPNYRKPGFLFYRKYYS